MGFLEGNAFCTSIHLLFLHLFGLFVYSYQGQFTINPAYQGIATFVWQTVANSLGLVSSLIAALLYGNVGIKVIYSNVLTDIFHFPNLGTRPGKLLWIAVVPVYWGLAFVVDAATPQVSNLSGLMQQRVSCSSRTRSRRFSCSATKLRRTPCWRAKDSIL